MTVNAGDKELTFDDLPEIMDAVILAKFLKVSRRTIHRRVKQGKLKAHGEPQRFFKEHVAEYLGIEYRK